MKTVEALRVVVVYQDLLEVWSHAHEVSDHGGVIGLGHVTLQCFPIPARHPDTAQAGRGHKTKLMGVGRWRGQAPEPKGVEKQLALWLITFQGLEKTRWELIGTREVQLSQACYLLQQQREGLPVGVTGVGIVGGIEVVGNGFPQDAVNRLAQVLIREYVQHFKRREGFSAERYSWSWFPQEFPLLVGSIREIVVDEQAADLAKGFVPAEKVTAVLDQMVEGSWRGSGEVNVVEEERVGDGVAEFARAGERQQTGQVLLAQTFADPNEDLDW
jgi:hypothetical protein